MAVFNSQLEKKTPVIYQSAPASRYRHPVITASHGIPSRPTQLTYSLGNWGPWKADGGLGQGVENPDLHTSGGGRSDPGALIQAAGGENGSKTGPNTGPDFWEHSLVEPLEVVTCVIPQPSEFRPRELLAQL